MVPALLGWLVVGLIAGFIASKIVNLRGDDPRLGMAAAVAGAFAGAVIYRMASGVEIRNWNPRSIFFAGLGAVITVILWHLIRSRTITHEAERGPRRSH